MLAYDPNQCTAQILGVLVNYGSFTLAVTFLVVSSIHSPSWGEELVSNQAQVVDGDTLRIDGERIRLHGIDAPETRQICTDDKGREWRCGLSASDALRNEVEGKTVECSGRERDRYDRLIATCFVDGTNLNAWLVQNGWALAYRRYSLEYVELEAMAQRRKAGLWSGAFDMPWTWRRAN